MSYRVSPSEAGWKYCTRCPLASTRRTVVLRGWGRVRRGSVDREGRSVYYGGVPSDQRDEGLILNPSGPFLLFIGDAPGELEDIRGLPFQGEAGRIFNQALSYCKTSFSFEATNLLGCRPRRFSSKSYSYVNRPPTASEVAACKPRLISLNEEIKYSALVYLGTLASSFKVRGKPTITLPHPAYIAKKEYKLYDIKLLAYKLDEFVLSLTK